MTEEPTLAETLPDASSMIQPFHVSVYRKSRWKCCGQAREAPGCQVRCPKCWNMHPTESVCSSIPCVRLEKERIRQENEKMRTRVKQRKLLFEEFKKRFRSELDEYQKSMKNIHRDRLQETDKLEENVIELEKQVETFKSQKIQWEAEKLGFLDNIKNSENTIRNLEEINVTEGMKVEYIEKTFREELAVKSQTIEKLTGKLTKFEKFMTSKDAEIKKYKSEVRKMVKERDDAPAKVEKARSILFDEERGKLRNENEELMKENEILKVKVMEQSNLLHQIEKEKKKIVEKKTEENEQNVEEEKKAEKVEGKIDEMTLEEEDEEIIVGDQQNEPAVIEKYKELVNKYKDKCLFFQQENEKLNQIIIEQNNTRKSLEESLKSVILTVKNSFGRDISKLKSELNQQKTLNEILVKEMKKEGYEISDNFLVDYEKEIQKMKVELEQKNKKETILKKDIIEVKSNLEKKRDELMEKKKDRLQQEDEEKNE